ncbi:MAG: hypothetical protein GX950_03525 [Candidatus Diapherotrites archaeon]|uniref:Uncharacterized protein n=1 Tax=Candidatus Iainarchaeum sp. TaxID=3101447 RepID=A0A7K4C091_9ARCH|nr:hypothetical protein [Candidatus Diapherotrites archaeon]
MNEYAIIVLFLLSIFFYTIEAGILGPLFLIFTIILLLDPLWDWLKKGKEEAKKIDAYYPEDKLKEYTKFASKKTGELLDSETKINNKNLLHKTPSVAKNIISEIEKIFK